MDKLGEGWLVGTISNGTEGDKSSIAFLPLGVHHILLDESDYRAKDITA